MSKVQLYIYDLSNGLAEQLSKQLTGTQINGIWHTSVVVYGKEVFYGQGIAITKPGESHHGSPLKIEDMGETDIDEATFGEYIDEIREQYTADRYHLLDYNCNSFTNDCVGFLTGGSIPAEILDLPSDFLSTPFGAALRPTIDAMFRGPVPGETPSPIPGPSSGAFQQAASASPDPALASALLQAVASQAYQNGSLSAPTSIPSTPAPESSTVAAPVHICTNPPSLESLLRSHRVAVVFFTSATCGPCKMIEPVFDELAEQKTRAAGSNRPAFVKVDMAVGMGSQVGAAHGVRVTPTFIFFLDGQKMHELKGVNGPELRTQVDLLLYQAYPPHPHTKLSLPSVEAFPMDPILFRQLPDINKVSAKLIETIEAVENDELSAEIKKGIMTAKQVISKVMVSFLKMRFPNKDKDGKPQKSAAAVSPGSFVPPATPQLLMGWASATCGLAMVLDAQQLFPLVDMWRLALLDENVTNWFDTPLAKNNVLKPLCNKALEVLESGNPEAKTAAYLLTLLRMLSNGFAYPTLRKVLMSPSGCREELTRVVVTTLLDEDVRVREAAASLTFNVAATLQKSRVEKIRGVTTGTTPVDVEENEDWEVEIISAVLQALSNEVKSEVVVHRLVVALAFLLRLSPSYEASLAPLLETLQSREMLLSKLQKGGCGENGVQDAKLRKMIQEVAEKLCN